MAQETEVKKRKRHGVVGLIRNRVAFLSERARDGDPKALDLLDQIILAQMELAAGTLLAAEQMGPDQPVRVFAVKPDPAAAKLILDHAFGRAKETVEIQDDGHKFDNLPQVILVPPMSYVRKMGGRVE